MKNETVKYNKNFCNYNPFVLSDKKGRRKIEVFDKNGKSKLLVTTNDGFELPNIQTDSLVFLALLEKVQKNGGYKVIIKNSNSFRKELGKRINKDRLEKALDRLANVVFIFEGSFYLPPKKAKTIKNKDLKAVHGKKYLKRAVFHLLSYVKVEVDGSEIYEINMDATMLNHTNAIFGNYSTLKRKKLVKFSSPFTQSLYKYLKGWEYFDVIIRDLREFSKSLGLDIKNKKPSSLYSLFKKSLKEITKMSKGKTYKSYQLKEGSECKIKITYFDEKKDYDRYEYLRESKF